MNPKFLDHFVIMVPDVKKAEIFYSKFLGAPLQFDQEQVAYQIGETKIFFGLAYKDWKSSDKDSSGLNHIAFGVRTLDELKSFEEVLGKNGIKNSGIQIDKFGKKEFIWFDDPNGLRLEFYYRP
jgi:glyoxylase I family protein